MSMMSPNSPVATVKPQPNIYTVLLAAAVVLLAVAVGICLYTLTTTYGLSFGEILKGQPVAALTN